MNQQIYAEDHSYYKGRLQKITKASSPLQAIYEAVTNSLEAIKILKKRHGVAENGVITINLFSKKNLVSKEMKEYDIERIEIVDTGVGFDEEEYNRLTILDDSRKGYSNKGTGRVQFLHVFNKTRVSSVYRDESSSTGFRLRDLTLSKSEVFLDNNAIIRLEEGNEEEVEAVSSSSTVVFEGVLEPKDQSVFNALSIEGLKQNIISRYLAHFCNNRNELPEFVLKQFIDGEFKKEVIISADSIPLPDKEEPLDIHYSNIRGKELTKSKNSECFQLKAFKVSSDKLAKNELKLTSKGEVVENAGIKLDGLLPKDHIAGFRYLFLLSGDYIDERDSDTRGKINIPRASDIFKDQTEMYGDNEVILLDDIEKKANNSILDLYNEINNKVQEKKQNIEELQKMFLLSKTTLEALKSKIGANDSDDTILRKVYEADAKIAAKKDAEIKLHIEEVAQLNPADGEYQDKLTAQVDALVKVIPQQNRTALTHYVARRKLVLELFDKVLQKQLDSLANGGRVDEDVMHNLIFQQSSESSETSDLWLIEDDFIYFKGVSEKQLNLIEIDGEKIFKESFAAEEEKYLNSLGEKRLTKRPDVLLFPDEGKCIIIEFKAPDVNASEHLTQVDFYANLIRNYTVDKLQINTFYGYLIGEDIEDRDVRGRVSRFEHSYHFDYWFRPSENVIGFDGRSNGSIYTEVLKYSTLLERAMRRNKIFIEKITQ